MSSLNRRFVDARATNGVAVDKRKRDIGVMGSKFR